MHELSDGVAQLAGGINPAITASFDKTFLELCELLVFTRQDKRKSQWNLRGIHRHPRELERMDCVPGRNWLALKLAQPFI